MDHPPALSPDEALTQFEVAEGLEIRLVVAEPDVFQPLAIRFDDRGRMWVLEYRQYPNPNGLTPVEMDQWLRTRYDRVPEPPPRRPPGRRPHLHLRGHDRGRPPRFDPLTEQQIRDLFAYLQSDPSSP